MLTCNHFNNILGRGGEGEREGLSAQHEVVLRIWAIVLIWDCR